MFPPSGEMAVFRSHMGAADADNPARDAPVTASVISNLLFMYDSLLLLIGLRFDYEG